MEKLLFEIPNIVSSEAPYGVEDKCAVMKTVGDIPEFDFEPADHLQLGEQLDAIDVSRGKGFGYSLLFSERMGRPA